MRAENKLTLEPRKSKMPGKYPPSKEWRTWRITLFRLGKPVVAQRVKTVWDQRVHFVGKPLFHGLGSERVSERANEWARQQSEQGGASEWVSVCSFIIWLPVPLWSKIEQVEQSSDNRCVLWRTARVLVFKSSFEWHTFLFLVLFCSNSAYFSEFNLCVTDGRTDRRTDTPSYRDARRI